MKRNSIAILVVFSTDNTIDEYAICLAQKIKELVRTLVVTVNGNINGHYLKDLQECCDDVFVRDNKGYDCGAYKETLESFIGFEKIQLYDEIVLLNDSCYGPIYPLEYVFKTMDVRNLDFWGITEQKPIKAGNYTNELLPYHIQTYFVVISKNMFEANAFKDFWKNIHLSDDYDSTVHNFELRFTGYFNSLGYRSGAFVDCDQFCKTESETQAYVFFDSYRLIAEAKCPFLKKKVFSFSHEMVLASNHGETAYKTLQYIEEYTNYDEKLIYKHLIKSSNVNELRLALHLDFCLSDEYAHNTEIRNNSVLVFFIDGYTDKDILDKLNIQLGRDIIVVCRKKNCEEFKEKHTYIENLKRTVICDDEEGLKNLYNWISGYEYICFIGNDYSQNKDESKMMLSNIVSNSIYVDNIISTFETNPFLGLLSIPEESKDNVLYDFETSNTNAALLAKRMGFDINIDQSKKGFSYGNSIWFRKKALESYLCNEKFCRGVYRANFCSDSPERNFFGMLYPYLVQQNGYYSGRVMTHRYAAMRINYLHKMLGKLVKNVLVYRGIQEFRNLRKVNLNLVDYCTNYRKIYVYGAGDIGNECCLYLKMNGIKVESFVVSDGRRTDQEVSNVKVKELSEIVVDDDMCVILAVNKKHMDVILGMLNNTGIENYISYEV